MKHLTTYITEYIIKKKLDKPIDSEGHYDFCPKSKGALKDAINELIKQNIYDFNCIDTSKITDMSSLFALVDNIDKNFDVSEWDVSNVTDMSRMFANCDKFDCDLSNWDVSNVENMSTMFYNCESFKGKGLENWDVNNVTDMYRMFFNCKNFNCDLSKWNVSNVENMFYLFDNCTSLKNTPKWYKE